MVDKLYDVEGVEIFATGSFHGGKYVYGVKDLDSMVTAFGKVGFIPPVKDGHHKNEPGFPALAWVRNVRRVGTKLLADFMEMPKVVYDAISTRRYDRVSAEVYHNYKDQNGTAYSRVLRAVALLGADLPEIKSLKPLREVVHDDNENKWESYDSKMNIVINNKNMKEEEMDPKEVKALLDESMKGVVTKFEDQLKEIGDKVMQKDKELETQATKIAELTESIKKKEAELAEFNDDDGGKKMIGLRKELDEQKKQTSELETNYSEMVKRNETLAETSRKERVKDKADACKFPVLRSYVEAMYDMATHKDMAEKKVVLLSADGKKEDEVPFETVIDKFTSTLNKLADNKLFQEQTKVPEFKVNTDDPDKSASEIMDDRIREFCSKNSLDYDTQEGYEKGLDGVKKEDPALFAEYAAG